MLPKTIRIFCFVDGSGRTNACAGYALVTDGQRFKSQGFKLVQVIRIPLRRLCKGWVHVYRAWIVWATHNMGI